MNRKFLIFIAILFMMVSCSTPSTFLRKHYLIEDLDPQYSADAIFKELAKDVDLKLIKGDHSPSVPHKVRYVHTETNVAFAPYTLSLIVARVKEEIAKESLLRGWSAEKRKEELEARLEEEMRRKFDEGQCFETKITSEDFYALANNIPKELDIKYWVAKLEQENRTIGLKMVDRPDCKIKTTFTSYGSILSDKKTYECWNVACTDMKIDLHKPFKVIVAASYKEGLIPSDLEWPGIKETGKH